MPIRNLVLLITAAFGLILVPGFIARFFPALLRSPRAVPPLGHAARHEAGR